MKMARAHPTARRAVLARMRPQADLTTSSRPVMFAIGMWAYYQGYLNIERLSKLMEMPSRKIYLAERALNFPKDHHFLPIVVCLSRDLPARSIMKLENC